MTKSTRLQTPEDDPQTSEARRADRRRPEERVTLDSLLASHAASMQPVLKQFERVAPLSVPLLITGESGTGKEVLARAVHRRSTRARRPFVAVNCAALPGELLEAELFGYERGAFTGATSRREGKFEAASDGTLLLDEVGDLPMSLQAKLLRALQERVFEPLGGNRHVPFQARLLSATSHDLHEAVAAGRFRLDLYYRIAVVTMLLPPLRDRFEDLGDLCRVLLDRHARREDLPRLVLAPGLHRQLTRYHWPGNIRELENVLISSAVCADGATIRSLLVPDRPRPPDLPGPHAAAAVPRPADPDEIVPLAELERRIVTAAVEATGGNLSEAARRLGIGRATLRRKLLGGGD